MSYADRFTRFSSLVLKQKQYPMLDINNNVVEGSESKSKLRVVRSTSKATIRRPSSKMVNIHQEPEIDSEPPAPIEVVNVAHKTNTQILIPVHLPVPSSTSAHHQVPSETPVLLPPLQSNPSTSVARTGRSRTPSPGPVSILVTEETRKKRRTPLVMAVNQGIDIPSGVVPNTEQKKRPLTAQPTSNLSRTSLRRSNSFASLSETRLRENSLMQTFSADHGLCDLSSLIENIMSMSWGDQPADREKNNKPSEPPQEKKTYLMPKKYHDDIQEESFMDTAYDYLHAGLKFATSFICTEEDLGPREDRCTLNGYGLVVSGRKLLLEGIHVNLGFKANNDGLCTNSEMTLLPRTFSRAKLEKSCAGKARLRFVIRLKYGEPHRVAISDSKWTWIYGEGRLGNVENFVEVTCPIGIHPSCMKCVWPAETGLLYIDAP